MEHSQGLTTYWDTEIAHMNMRVEIIPTIFSNHNAFKLEINCRKKSGRTTNTWRFNNMLLKNNWVREEIKTEIKRYIETNDNDNTTYQLFWDTAKWS